MQNLNNSRHKIPVVLTAFGTSEKAFLTYGHMDGIFRSAFGERPIEWAYSSRLISSRSKGTYNCNIKDPLEVLNQLILDGHEWAVVQSLHITGGHEFQRLVRQVYKLDIRVSMGLPLLTSVQDYMETIDALSSLVPEGDDEAVIFAGHGTDHPAWTSYVALGVFLKQKYGPKVFVGVLEGCPDINHTIDRIKAHGFKKVRIVPLMLVAGMHFKRELTGREDSWEKSLREHGIQVDVIPQGLGETEEINRIFIRHITEALDVIPLKA